MFFPANLNLEWKGHEIPLSSPNQVPQTEVWASCLWYEFLTFPGLRQLSQDPGCRLRREWGVPAGLILAPKS